jgi:hypothetical protein
MRYLLIQVAVAMIVIYKLLYLKDCLEFMESKTLIYSSAIYKRAFTALEYHLMNKFNLYKNCLPEQIKENLVKKDFKELRGFLYSLFDDNEILISVYPTQISKYRRGVHWEHSIKLDGIEINEDSFHTREQAEFIAFSKAFQFLDTKIFIEQTKDRFYDDSSDSSCVKMNWEHLNKILNYKRKNG